MTKEGLGPIAVGTPAKGPVYWAQEMFGPGGSECPRCGMLAFACCCIPWCWEHDCQRPCCECAKKPVPVINPETWVVLGICLMIALWSLASMWIKR